jgi:hypothetical protein
MSCCLVCEVTVDDLWRWCPECGGALYGDEHVDLTVRKVVVIDEDTGSRVELESEADLDVVSKLAEGLW